MTAEKTLPKLLLERARSIGNNVALRQKELGIWNEMTWAQYSEKVKQLAIALSSDYNFTRGERLAIIGENRPQWVVSQLAAQSLGGISVGIYQESLPQQLIYFLNDCKARIVIAEDQEQVDKLLEIENQIPLVEHIIYYNQQGMRGYEHPKLAYFEDLLASGTSLMSEKADFIQTETERGLGDDIAIISYSSATTGNPKGIMLTHANLIAASENLAEIDKVELKDDYLSFLSLAWIQEQVMSIVMPLTKGMVINFPEQPSTLLTDLREIGPHAFIAPPRVYQSFISSFTIRIQGASWLKKKLYNAFKKYADKVAHAKLNNKSVSFGTKFMNGIGDFLIFSAIRDHLGLARIKRAYVAGASLSNEAIHFFQSIGVNIKQSYGGTELSGMIFVHRDNNIRTDSVGVPLPNTEVKISEDGEIFVKSPSMFAGYIHKEHAEEGQSQDGWLSLGDCGRIDENGHLYISERKEELICIDDGESISPSFVENKLKVSPYIQEAVCYGKNKPYLTALLNIDMNSVGRWAEKHQIVYTTYSDLSRKQEVIELIEKEVIELMKQLPQHSRVKKFVIMHKQLNANDEELTRTYKVRRKHIEEKYRALIDGLYSGTEEVKVADTVASSDGKESVVETNLQVIHLEVGQEVA